MDDLDSRIARAVEPIPSIAALAVFGSRARGTQRPDSDLDVAIIPNVEDARSRRHLLADTAVALADLAPEGRVDVVLLDEATDVLRQRVFETGRLVLCRDPTAWRELRVRTMREYGDREWVRNLMMEAQKKRLEEGKTRGRSAKAIRSLERTGKLSR